MVIEQEVIRTFNHLVGGISGEIAQLRGHKKGSLSYEIEKASLAHGIRKDIKGVALACAGISGVVTALHPTAGNVIRTVAFLGSALFVERAMSETVMGVLLGTS